MTNPTPDHPTQPPAVPDELLVQWINEATAEGSFEPIYSRALARRLTAWAWAQRDGEVREAEDAGYEAACAELDALGEGFLADKIRATRRPAPPTLREQALAALEGMQDLYPHMGNKSIIREALQEVADG